MTIDDKAEKEITDSGVEQIPNISDSSCCLKA